ncbi:hypothetical protein CEXT_207701 [Caerostris extrusa]|uniref:Uncharacterized protein n=1 Tax=Caerostris extrusa TaxID=172846 RepID=A0AAV4Q617_CAEEX|nr:hypothetical protein CEXT_207701 [Caerostris extrusa]
MRFLSNSRKCEISDCLSFRRDLKTQSSSIARHIRKASPPLSVPADNRAISRDLQVSPKPAQCDFGRRAMETPYQLGLKTAVGRWLISKEISDWEVLFSNAVSVKQQEVRDI